MYVLLCFYNIIILLHYALYECNNTYYVLYEYLIMFLCFI